MMYDLVIIGAGWAGFNAAQRAKELGLKVALIEKEKIGGTCLNYGCIPTKTLIQSAKVYTLIKKSKNFGIETAQATIKINFKEMQTRKEKIIEQLRRGMEFMLKGIDILIGEAQILSRDTLKIKPSNNLLKVEQKELKAKNIIIATGAKPLELGNLKFDGKKILSSDDILNLDMVPKSLLIIGGGVIGCEFASLFSALGGEVAIVELMPQLLPGMDKEVVRKLENTFKKKGIKVNTNTDAKTVNLKGDDLVLLCLGRSPQTQTLGLDKIGLKIEKSRIVVDEYLRTNLPNIYAAGDCTGQIMLAHFAAYQGKIAAENIVQPDACKKVDHLNIPHCIFTEPQIASVGLDEEVAKNKGVETKINKFDFLGSGMARIIDEAEGFIKIISDKKSGQVLGASLIGPQATELIGILTLAVTSHLKVSQLKETIFAHPTLSESIAETFNQ